MDDNTRQKLIELFSSRNILNHDVGFMVLLEKGYTILSALRYWICAAKINYEDRVWMVVPISHYVFIDAEFSEEIVEDSERIEIMEEDAVHWVQGVFNALGRKVEYDKLKISQWQ